MHKQILPIGPYHPALKEPEYFKVWLDGEEITRVELRLGYNYRGIEKLAARREWRKALYLVERTCGICGINHSTNFCRLVEKLGEIEVPKRAKWIRCLFLELNRIQSHLIFLGIIAYVIGFDTLFQWCWAARELPLEWIEKAVGNRIHYSINCFGGVRRDLSQKLLKELNRMLERLEEKLKEIKDVFISNELTKKRLSSGRLPQAMAKKLGVVGPTARGSGINIDVRKDKPYHAYSELEFKIPCRKEGNSYARTLVRLEECFQSIKIANQIREGLPSGSIGKEKPSLSLPQRKASLLIEAPRGELLHYVSSGGKQPSFVRLRTPTQANIIAVREMAKDEKLADFPPILESIDPCFGCCDRMSIIKDCKERTISYKKLKELSRNENS